MFWLRKSIFLCCWLGLANNANAQAYHVNEFFNELSSISFFTPDSNNHIYPEIKDMETLTSQLNTYLPFTLYHLSKLKDIAPISTINVITGLHNQVPWFDTMAYELKGSFVLDSTLHHWYGYYNPSLLDTSMAFFVIPGSGFEHGFQLSCSDTSNYHNKPSPIRNICLKYGDMYVYTKPNDGFRAFWHYNDWVGTYYRLNSNLLESYTQLNGNHWAINMYVECVAAIKCLKKKYKKVVVLGLSAGGFPALMCGIQGGADGIVCAAGLSVSSYKGIPLSNWESPHFHSLLKMYNLDTVVSWTRSTPSYFLFSYGKDDYTNTNAYEYANHSLEQTIQSPDTLCNVDFYYNFEGHHFPIAYLDTFFTRVKNDSCNLTTSISYTNNYKQDNENVSLYPNPIEHTTKLRVETNRGLINQVKVYDAMGAMVKSLQHMSSQKLYLSLSGLTSGTYTALITVDEQTYVKQFVVYNK